MGLGQRLCGVPLIATSRSQNVDMITIYYLFRGSKRGIK